MMTDSSTPEQLGNELYAQITALCQHGDTYAENQQYERALAHYHAALQLLPEPIERWEAATWILGAIGDAAFLKGDYQQARHALHTAMHCPDAIGNPFLHLRLGQVQFELGNTERAADELARAYMGGGREIFDDEDSKYTVFIRQILKDM